MLIFQFAGLLSIMECFGSQSRIFFPSGSKVLRLKINACPLCLLAACVPRDNRGAGQSEAKPLIELPYRFVTGHSPWLDAFFSVLFLWEVLVAGVQRRWFGARTQVLLLAGFLPCLVARELNRASAASALMTSGPHLKRRGAAIGTRVMLHCSLLTALKSSDKHRCVR